MNRLLRRSFLLLNPRLGLSYTASNLNAVIARNLERGEMVYVPRSRLDLTRQDSSAFFRTKVLEVLERSVRISLPGGGTAEIGSSQVRRDTGVLLINVGDFESKVGLFNKIENSIYKYISLLL